MYLIVLAPSEVRFRRGRMRHGHEMAMIDAVPHVCLLSDRMRICGPHIELTLTRYMGSGITLRVLQYRDHYYLFSRDVP